MKIVRGQNMVKKNNKKDFPYKNLEALIHTNKRIK